MKFIVTLFLFSLIIYVPSFSQVDSLSLKRIYEKEVIYFSGNKYIKNNTLYPIKNLKTEFKKNSEGYLVYEMAQKDDKKFTILYTIGFAGYIAGFAMLEDKPNTGAGVMIAGSVPLVISFHFAGRSDKRKKKAVWLRNRDILIERSY